MRNNNGILVGILTTFFPGLLRLLSIFPRVCFLIFSGVAIVVAIVLYFLEKKDSRVIWVLCSAGIISLLLGLFSYSKPNEETIDTIIVSTRNTIPQKLLDRADEGDVDAQVEVVMQLLKSYQSDSGYSISLLTDVETMNKYASLAAENGSSQGYMLSGVMNANGWGGPILRNQAIADFRKAIDINPDYKSAYINLLQIDSLEVTHPDIYREYLKLYQEYLDREDQRKQYVIDSLNILINKSDLTKDELGSYLDAYDEIIYPIMADNKKGLITLLSAIVATGQKDKLIRYNTQLGADRSLTSVTALLHVPQWNLNKNSDNLDSLLKIASVPMLSMSQHYTDSLDLDGYIIGCIDQEMAIRKFQNGTYDTEAFKASRKSMDNQIKRLSKTIRPVIGRGKPDIGEQQDSLLTLTFRVNTSHQPHSTGTLKVINEYIPFILNKAQSSSDLISQ